MAKDKIGKWIVRTDGSKSTQAARPTGDTISLAINGKTKALPANEPFEPTQEELDVLQASYYAINGQVQRYTLDDA